MKHFCIPFIFVCCGALSPVLASPGDFENRIREAELSGNRNLVRTLCKEWYASGQYSSGLLQWNYNALMSVEQNALLITQQESDTYPAMLLQYALQVRPDVRVLNIQWLENQKYREFLIAQGGWSWIPANSSLPEFLNQLLYPKLAQNTAPGSVYFGSMTNKNLLLQDKEKLYLTGLALKFSAQPFDNVAILRYNFERLFHTDYLELSLDRETDSLTVARINLNYIPAMVLLHRHYTAAGENARAERIKTLVQQIARSADREAEIRAFFEPEQAMRELVSSISVKALEKAMKKIQGKFYAAETETTNAQYELFLTDLVKNKDFEQLDRFKTSKTDWIALLSPELQNLPVKEIFRHGHPDDPEMPVQNISQEAAQAYCGWITRVYNSSAEKRKFKKVLFRLPTETEWMTAAKGGLKDTPYPWPGGYFVQNVKGCYLGNYNTTEPCGDCPDQYIPFVPAGDKNSQSGKTTANKPEAQADKANMALGSLYDGGFFAVPVNSYYPNKFGLYAMSGNVAEMTSEPGKTKGGSWQDIPYYGQIQTVKMYDKPSPAVGFRVFMEVIEE